MAVAQVENRSLAGLSLLALQDEVATLASHIYAETCRWLELVAELDRRGAWAERGCGSCAEWLAWRCALAPRAAREHVRVARALGELPAIRAAFACGELSYAKVRALTRIATPEAEEELLRLARHLTAAQLERAVAGYRYVTAKEADDLHAYAHLGWSWADDGSLIVRGRLAPEQGALFLRALEAAREALREQEAEEDMAAAGDRGDGSAEPRPSPRRAPNAEAFAAMVERSLSAGEERAGGERYQVVVHVDRSTLAHEEPGACRLEDGPALAAETARRLACDASVVTIDEQDGEPLSLGRKTRAVPSALRRALQVRDRGCRFPGCENRRYVQAHHIRHWARGGETRIDNLVLLCGRHHRLVHEGGYRVGRLEDGELVFRDPWGGPVLQVPGAPPGDLDDLLDDNDALGIHAWTCASGDGDRMDLTETVDGFLDVFRTSLRAGDP